MRRVSDLITGKETTVLSHVSELRNFTNKNKEILSTSEPTPGVVLRIEVTSHLLIVGGDVTLELESPYDGDYTVSAIIDNDFFEVLL